MGYHIAKIFAARGWETYALVNKTNPPRLAAIPNLRIVKGDLTAPGINEAITAQIGLRPDIVVHAAALASDIGPDKVFKKINFEAVKTISRLPAEKFIYISSTDVYGMKDFNGETEEELPFEQNPRNPYPKYKIEGEKWLRVNTDNNKLVIIRPAAVWGEGDKTLSIRVADFLSFSPYIITFGKWKGTNRWPYANVENVAKVCYACACTDAFNGLAVNIIDPKKSTIEDYYKDVAAQFHPQKKFKTINLPLWTGILMGGASTILSNLLRRTSALFDPSYYALLSISRNLDFSCERQNEILRYYEENLRPAPTRPQDPGADQL